MSQEQSLPLPTTDEVLRNPATSYWLKTALETALQRDALDAAHDAELLMLLLRARLDEVFRQAGVVPDDLPPNQSLPATLPPY